MKLVSTDFVSRMMSALKSPSPHFQRAINIKYDLGNVDYIAAYVPTPNAIRAMKVILSSGMHRDARQRATLLHGPYGSGKSLLTTVLSAILSRDGELREALTPIIQRLQEADPEGANLIEDYLRSGPRLLPITLSGNEGDLGSSLLRGLTQGLLSVGLGDIRPRTHYQAALDTISMWEVDYPEAFDKLVAFLESENYPLRTLVRGLEFAEVEAYELFQRLYPRLTAGATFDNFHGQSVVKAYQETVEILRESSDYDGVVVLWDEFGRFLDDRIGEPFGREAALLQEFAEFSCRSSQDQVHLILIAHRVMSGYAWGLPDEYLQEWQRISERFRTLDVSGDPLIAYRLIASALDINDPEIWANYLTAHRTDLARMMEDVLGHGLFPELTEDETRRWILEGAYPVHPLAVYCLPRLSNRIAQNERTLFTFLAADEGDTLVEYLSRMPIERELQWVGIHALYDYFSEAMRTDTGPGGVHGVWAASRHALNKTPAREIAIRNLIKALAVLQAVGETGTVSPTTATLAFALDMDAEQVEESARYLVRRKLARLQRINRTWELAIGSDVDVETAIAEVLDRRPPTSLQLRRILEKSVTARSYQARRYNAEYGMIRFFRTWYRHPKEIENVNWQGVLKELGYADGLVVFVLARNAGELREARTVVESTNADRVLFVLPRKPLLIEDLLHELFALTELKNEPEFREKDERIVEELEFFIEDIIGRIERALAPLIDPWQNDADWYWRGETWTRFPIDSPGRVTRLVSDVCSLVFPQTPVTRNEALNRRMPSKVQSRASEKVIEALLTNDLDERLGLTGYGPDWLIVNTILRLPGILQQDEQSQWIIDEPADEQMAQVWLLVQEFFQRAREEEQSFAYLLDTLQSPPLGLRLGILPVLIAAALREHLHVATVRHDRKPVLPLTGSVFVEMCKRPDHYTLELGPEDTRQAAIWKLLEENFGGRILPEERRHQPLRYLSLGMLRWLHSLPRFAQATKRLSADALCLRQLIKTAVEEPGHVLFDDLPTLLENEQLTVSSESTYYTALNLRLRTLMGELETAYLDLLRRLDRFAVELFAPDASVVKHDGNSALRYWVACVEQQCACALSDLRFGDTQAEGLVQVALSEVREGVFWDTLTRKIFGFAPRDWDDRSEERFYEILHDAKTVVERGSVRLTNESDEVVQINMRVGMEDSEAYHFRQVPLSERGERLLQHFISTLKISGRPLSLDERRRLVVALLQHVMDEDAN